MQQAVIHAVQSGAQYSSFHSFVKKQAVRQSRRMKRSYAGVNGTCARRATVVKSAGTTAQGPFRSKNSRSIRQTLLLHIITPLLLTHYYYIIDY
jgi:hypothetical protein